MQVLDKIPKSGIQKNRTMNQMLFFQHTASPDLPKPRPEFLDHRLFVVGSINIKAMGATLGIKVGFSSGIFHLFHSHNGVL